MLQGLRCALPHRADATSTLSADATVVRQMHLRYQPLQPTLMSYAS